FKNQVSIRPLLYGGTGTDGSNLNQPLTPPEGQEAGTLNTAGIRGLKEGIKWTKRHFETINYNVKYLSEYIIDELKKIDAVRLYSPYPNGVISFNIGDMPSTEVADVLDQKYSICVRAGLHCAPLMHKRLGTLNQGAVRASVGYNNTESDAVTFIKAIKEIATYN
ncbi:MAG: aminotransferase class V-fold PLP-dependent enzyme, partial [Clostridia bacterium]|nr:aminotransferase class V-fold PLP-dependent enzyme [Clostridia bacterium]